MKTLLITLAILSWMFSQGIHALTLVSQSLTVNGNTVTLNVPSGTRLQYMASIPGARFLTVGPDGELIVGSNGSGVYRLAAPYRTAESLVNIGSRSHSVAYRNGKLFVASAGGLYEATYSGTSTSLQPSSMQQILTFPTGGHSSRTVIVGPDSALYIGIGISGNCSDEYIAGSAPDYPFSARRGGVWRVDETSGTPALVPFSSGLRNPIGLAVNPISDELWTTNAGSDNLGYHLPREIFSRLSEDSWHGMPWFQYIGSGFQAQNCISSAPPRPAGEATPPSVTFDARSTPMGIAFLQNNRIGNGTSGNALVSVHGSWATNGGANTKRPPKIVMVNFLGAEPSSMEDVITGFQRQDGSRFARPSGAVIGADGYFYFTSDGGDVHGLFRLINVAPQPPAPPPPGNSTSATVAPSVSILLDD